MTSDDAPATSAEHPKRTIKSYALRAGRMTLAQERAWNELWPRYGLDQAKAADLTAAFGRSAPRMIEIGFGAGEALVAFAQQHPDFDCIGIDVHKPGVGHLMLEVERRGLTNVRVVAHDAVEVLSDWLPEYGLRLAHVFFPDPWPKKRHHKRRLLQAPFIALLAKVLERGGELRLATDWEHYAMEILATMEASTHFTNVNGTNNFAPRPDTRPLTRFERRGQRLGHGVWDLHYRRV